MPKKNQTIKPLSTSLPSGKYYITGVTPEQEEKVRGHIGDIAPDVYPDQIAFLPSDKFRAVQDQISKGHLGQTPIKVGERNSNQEGHNFQLGNAFSLTSNGRMYVDAKMLENEKELKPLLAHELGHFAAGPKDQSEWEANEWRDKVYLPRAKAQEQLTSTVGQLPMRPVTAAPLPEPLPPPAPPVPPLGRIGSPEEDAYKLKALPR